MRLGLTGFIVAFVAVLVVANGVGRLLTGQLPPIDGWCCLEFGELCLEATDADCSAVGLAFAPDQEICDTICQAGHEESSSSSSARSGGPNDPNCENVVVPSALENGIRYSHSGDGGQYTIEIFSPVGESDGAYANYTWQNWTDGSQPRRHHGGDVYAIKNIDPPWVPDTDPSTAHLLGQRIDPSMPLIGGGNSTRFDAPPEANAMRRVADAARGEKITMDLQPSNTVQFIVSAVKGVGNAQGGFLKNRGGVQLKICPVESSSSTGSSDGSDSSDSSGSESSGDDSGECNDEEDNDNDDLTDYPLDPECESTEDDSEDGDGGDSCKPVRIAYFNLQPNPQFVPSEKTALDVRDYNVRYFDRNTFDHISRQVLSPSRYDVAFFFNGCGGDTGLLSAGELDAIRQFYEAGGHLHLTGDDNVGDSTQGSGDCQTRVNQIAENIGAKLSGMADNTGNACQEIESDHPIFRGDKAIGRETDAFLTLQSSAWGGTPEIIATQSNGNAAIAFVEAGGGHGSVIVNSNETGIVSCGSQKMENYFGYLGFHKHCNDNPECSDGKDNDNDGNRDFPTDRGCTNADDDEGGEPTSSSSSSSSDDCVDAARMAIDFEEVKNRGNGNLQAQVFLGTTGQSAGGGEFFDITQGHEAVIDDGLDLDAPGLAIERGDGFVRVILNGNLGGSFPAQLEAVLGAIRLEGARITRIESDDQYPSEYPFNGTYDDTDVYSDDELFPDGRFYMSVDTFADGLILYYAVDGSVSSEPCSHSSSSQSSSSSSGDSCGNNNLDEGEQCDDGNTLDGDGCSSTCQFENSSSSSSTSSVVCIARFSHCSCKTVCIEDDGQMVADCARACRVDETDPYQPNCGYDDQGNCDDLGYGECTVVAVPSTVESGIQYEHEGEGGRYTLAITSPEGRDNSEYADYTWRNFPSDTQPRRHHGGDVYASTEDLRWVKDENPVTQHLGGERIDPSTPLIAGSVGTRVDAPPEENAMKRVADRARGQKISMNLGPDDHVNFVVSALRGIGDQQGSFSKNEGRVHIKICPESASSSSASSLHSAAPNACGNLQKDVGEQCGEPGLSCPIGKSCGTAGLEPGQQYQFNIVTKTDDAICGSTVRNKAKVTAKKGSETLEAISGSVATQINCGGIGAVIQNFFSGLGNAIGSLFQFGNDEGPQSWMETVVPFAHAQNDSCLFISKEGPSSVQKGQSIEYIVTVRNECDEAVTEVEVTDDLSEGLTYDQENSHPLCEPAERRSSDSGGNECPEGYVCQGHDLTCIQGQIESIERDCDGTGNARCQRCSGSVPSNKCPQGSTCNAGSANGECFAVGFSCLIGEPEVVGSCAGECNGACLRCPDGGGSTPNSECPQGSICNAGGTAGNCFAVGFSCLIGEPETVGTCAGECNGACLRCPDGGDLLSAADVQIKKPGFFKRLTAALWPFRAQVSNDQHIAVDLAFSTDGITYYHSLTGGKALEPNEEFIVQIGYDNWSETPVTAATIVSQLPAGFSLVSGSTKNCLQPSEDERVCNTDSGQAGGIQEGSVWSNTSLTIAPTAGLYDIPGGAREGILDIGKKRYVNYKNCDYYANDRTNTDDTFFFEASNTAISNITYSGTGPTDCPAAVAGTHYRGLNSAQFGVDIFGKRYANGKDCDYINDQNSNTDQYLLFSPSNTPLRALDCSPAYPGTTWRPVNSTFQPADHLGSRYLNFQNCDYKLNGHFNTDDIIGFAPSNTPITMHCGPGDAKVTLRAQNSKALPIDLLDVRRGKGFIEFRVKAPSQAGTYEQGAEIRGEQISTVRDSGTIEVMNGESSSSVVCRISDCQCTGGENCGNGKLDLGEECDDGNRIDGDCCSSSCEEEPGCVCLPPD